MRAARELSEHRVDVIVLDVSSLRAAGEQLCRSLRQMAPSARLILISETPGLSSACYDHRLIHPVSPERLVAAIQEAMNTPRRQVIVAGDFVLDMDHQTVMGPAGEVRLTPKLLDLMRLFMTRPNQLVLRQTLMQEVWHTNYLEDTRTLDVHISWLRGHIEPDPHSPRYLVTKRGAGYIFRPNGQDAPQNQVAVDTLSGD
ncbi:MAG: response regulator transcription factor [Caldilineales bacterium]|nr:response regulator transcription factor [Caldilineales bacterium]MDW8316632.1 response regulator transcription factor [Anaerolineae bacterium]